MASKADLWDQLAKAIKIVDKTYAYGVSDTPNVATMIDTIQQAFEGNHIQATQGGLSSFRSGFCSLISGFTASLNAIILDLAKTGYSSLATSALLALDDISAGMTAATETIKNRGFTFDTITVGGSNVGNGTVYRTTMDKNALALENAQGIVGDVKVRITGDRTTGKTQGNEEAVIYGDGVVKTDEIALGDAPSGSVGIQAKRSTDGLLQNSSFDTTSGTGATFDASSWTLSSAANFASETTTYYRKTAGLTTGASLRFLNNGNILQNLGTVNLDPQKPCILLLRFYRETSCDGTLTLALGTQSVNVALSAQSGWTELALGIDASAKGWYDVFKQDNSGLGVQVKITLASRTTGTLLVDEILLIQPTFFSGAYYLLTAGPVDYLKEDNFKWDDTASETGRIQYWLARLYGKHLPHTSGSPTYADAT